jgi:hypothetical protein
MDIEEIARLIVDAALKVHRQFGPGLSSRHIKPALPELSKLGRKYNVKYPSIRYDNHWINQATGLICWSKTF